jgi:hypothetical protein|tara:strand:- start:584 stop:1480 length:897 start_codon:yes stop_codon:yes gene_type:complete
MELKDKKVDRFSQIVAREFGMLEWNEGKIGAGNDYIQRSVFNAVLGNKKHYSTAIKNIKVIKHTYDSSPTDTRPTYPLVEGAMKDGYYEQVIQSSRDSNGAGTPDLVVCMWSGINRHELLRLSSITNNWSWVVNTWASFGLDLKTLRATPDSLPYIDKQFAESGDGLIVAGYLKRIRNAHMNLRLTIGHMLSVKYLLEAKGIPQLHYLFSQGQYRPLLPVLDWDTFENTNVWWDSLDLSKDQLVAELPVLKSEGFYDLTKRLKLPIGPKDHPLEQAHAHMARRIITDIKNNEFNTAFD